MARYLFHGVSMQNKRPSNMDSLLLKSGRLGPEDALLAVVCDGVGSLRDGAMSSGLAVSMLDEWFMRMVDAEWAGLRLRDAILAINAHIVGLARANAIDTATTLSALLLVEDDYYIAHIGDSRIYCLGAEGLSVLTDDDTTESGALSAYIGKDEDIFMQYCEGSACGKTFLLCSDGLYKRMDMVLLAQSMHLRNRRSLKEAVQLLPEYVIGQGEQDNITLAILKTKKKG